MPTCAVAFVLMGLGLAPGFGASTFGSLVLYHAILAAILVLFSWSCVAYGHAAEAHFGKKDPGSVCADETAGQAIPLMFLPAALPAWTAVSVDSRIDRWIQAAIVCGLAFLAFRIFDIIKLWPARSLQRLTGGWGILVDDLIAGVHAMIVVQVVVRVVG